MKEIKVAGAVIVSNNKILIAERGYGEFKGMWEFPGGKISDKETYEETVVREIKEELNLNISVKKYITDVRWKYDNFSLYMKLFLCEIRSGNLKLLEHMSYKWIGKSELHKINFLPADKSILSKLIRII